MSSKILEEVWVIILIRNRRFLLHGKILAHSLFLMLPDVSVLKALLLK